MLYFAPYLYQANLKSTKVSPKISIFKVAPIAFVYSIAVKRSVHFLQWNYLLTTQHVKIANISVQTVSF